MDGEKDKEDLIRTQLKILLLHLAAKSENPGMELQGLVQEVLDELHEEVKKRLVPKLKLVEGQGTIQ